MSEILTPSIMRAKIREIELGAALIGEDIRIIETRLTEEAELKRLRELVGE